MLVWLLGIAQTCPNGSPGTVLQYSDRQLVIKKIVTKLGAATDIPPLFIYGQGSVLSVMAYAERHNPGHQ